MDCGVEGRGWEWSKSWIETGLCSRGRRLGVEKRDSGVEGGGWEWSARFYPSSVIVSY